MIHKFSIRKALMLLLVAGLVLLTAWCVYTAMTLRKVSVALADLRNPDPAISAAAAERLSRCTSPIAIRRIIDASGDEDADSDALEDVLAKIGEPAVRPLVRVLAPPPQYLLFIEDFLPERFRIGDRREGIVYFAMGALVEIGAPAVPELLRALERGRPAVRKMAADTLGGIGDPRAIEPLITALKDAYEPVRWSAAWALGELGDARALEPLIAALKDSETIVRWQAARALGQIGDPRAIEPLVAVLTDEDLDLRYAAAEALGELGDARALEPLIAALKDSDSNVRCHAAEALGELGDARAIEPLIAALGDADSDVRGQAAEALGEIGDARAVEPLVLLLGDSVPYVVGQAAVSLEYIGGETAKAAVDRYIAGRDIAKVASDYKTFFASGDPNSRYMLMIALERHGTLIMAEDFRWSGEFDLETAARRWAQAHGLTKELEVSKDSPVRPKWK